MPGQEDFPYGVTFDIYGQRPAAVVDPIPPVNISRYQWEVIQRLLREAVTLGDLIDGRDPATVLLSGSDMVAVIAAAREIRHLLGP